MSTLIPKNRKWIILGILSFIHALSVVLLAYVTKLILDYAVNLNKDMVIYSIIMYFCLIIFSVVIKFVSDLLYSKYLVKREMELKRLMFEKRLKMNFNLSNIHSGLLLQSYTTDIDNIVSTELDTLPSIFYEAGRFIFAVGLVVFIDWKFLVILFVLGVIGLFAVRFYSVRMKIHHKANLEADGVMNSFFQEANENLKLIQAYDSYYNFIQAYDVKEANTKNVRRKKLLFQVFIGNVIVLGSNIIYGISIAYGGISIVLQLMTFGSLTALLQLMGHIQNPILSVSGIVNKLALYKTSFQRLDEKLTGDIICKSEIDDFDFITIKNASFGYDISLFRNLSFVINKGDIVKVNGESGIGKTTLFMTLLGFLKLNEGEIYASFNGQKYQSFKNVFAYVSQENLLFSGSIRENFVLLTGKDSNITEALKFANVYDEIMQMPKGIDTILNERGNGLSIGQIQRIIIAIAYASGRKVFLLDEFTSALDKDNAKAICDNIIASGKTVIYISHKNESFIPNKVLNLSEYK